MVRRYFLPILLAIIAIDQVTKWWAETALADGRRIPILGDVLSLVLVYNPGAAFSFGTDHTYFFTVFSVVVLAIIGYLVPRTRSAPWVVALGTIAGGAAGNLVDRLAREPRVGEGHVVDFINYNGYFVGNVADIALVAGVLVVLVLEFRSIPFRPAAPSAGTPGTGDSPGTVADGESDAARPTGPEADAHGRAVSASDAGGDGRTNRSKRAGADGGSTDGEERRGRHSKAEDR